jgi:hypothetical protein
MTVGKRLPALSAAMLTQRAQVRRSLEKAWRAGRFADKNALDYYACVPSILTLNLF